MARHMLHALYCHCFEKITACQFGKTFLLADILFGRTEVTEKP
jgi:hypothetical protein